ncbi:MAG TPA: glycosyltransferase N-terminal domain-containing protein [Chitinophagaceae bacterium]|nr:glycosyltransferase N-terminal domain-containing protein [Chitinophagaceae bacterium]
MNSFGEIRFAIKKHKLGLLLYTIFLNLYSVGIRIATLWSDKALLWRKGRKKFPSIEPLTKINNTVWMHCASLGEFEQGRPLIEEIRKQYPNHILVITFFSPSGYEIVKNFTGADHIFYLPADSVVNAKKFVELINPKLVLWVKYEYWYYYLHELKKRNIPALLISGSFRNDHPFFKWYGKFWREMLSCFTFYFVQNESSKKLLEDININNIIVSGDTRLDRVITIAENSEEVLYIKEFCGNNKVIVAGSTWDDDEAELVHYTKTNCHIKFIIAPHAVDKENLKDIKKTFIGSIFYSEWIGYNEQQAIGNNQDKLQNTNCLIIDSIGILSKLYKYADIAYVGGGFGDDGLHNILEAVVYGKPVIFGPAIEKNFEAHELIECGGGITIENALELEKTLTHLFKNEDELKSRGLAAKNYVYNKAGATKKIMEYIQVNRLLTN